MVRVLKKSSGRALIAGLFGTAVIITLVMSLLTVTGKAEAAPFNCVRQYKDYRSGWDWDAGAYHYKVFAFTTSGDGNAAQNSLIDSNTCGGDAVQVNLSDPYFMYQGATPRAAYLGLDHPWQNFADTTVAPDSHISPPVHQSDYSRAAAFVDDGAMVLINDQMAWCADLRTGGFQGLPDNSNCDPDISTFSTAGNPAAGAGYLLTDTADNCANAINCSNAANFKWYKPFNNNSRDYSSKIGWSGTSDATRALNNFDLRMVVRQTASGGFGTTTYFAFEYPKASMCVGVTAPATVAVGQTFSGSVQFRNTGNVAWNPTGVSPHRIGASDPRDTPKWGPITQPGNPGYNNRLVLPGIIAPGQTTPVINFSAKANVAGTNQAFSWEVVQEGVTWVGDGVLGSGKCSVNINVTGGSPPLLHKIYGANIVELSQAQVRDNETVVASLKTYLWPDAGLRSSSTDRTNRLWLAGVYGEQGTNGVDNTAEGASNPNADLNNMTIYNTKAELNCPSNNSNCLKRVPLAYVPASDGTAAGSATKDGGTTPNGNKWQPIRDRIFGSYSARLGGIASTDNSFIGGYSGNHIHNVEISNIRVEAIGPQPDATNAGTQGGVTSTILQPDTATQSANLPNGSQGPIAGGAGFNAWDNIRKPGAPGGLTVTSTQPSVDFSNVGGSPANFTLSPEQLLAAFSSTVAGLSKTYATANVTSLLQDGNDRDHPAQPYSNLTEPLTYTAGIGSITNARLKWDEYVDWSQVDDKGHYFTQQDGRATGAYTGPSSQATGTIVTSVDTGYSQYAGEEDDYGYVYRCDNHNPPNCGYQWEVVGHHSVYTQCQNASYNTSAFQNSHTLYYYNPSVQSQYGWINQNANFGTANAVPGSTRFWPTRSGTPAWALLGTGNPLSPFFYQDPAVTSMSTSGSTNRQGQSQSPSWIQDHSDPAYTNRYLFVHQTPLYAPDGIAYGQSTYCVYPNGGSVTTQDVSVTVYPSNGLLYENSSGSYTGVAGQYDFTYDGNKDGSVDYTWDWAQNLARVRYEQTYNGNYRNLGARSTDGLGGLDGTLYGIEGYPSYSKPARASAIIGNPIISAASGDIFSAGGISSYFKNSSATSAFIFTNSGSITNFVGASGYFPNYYINPDTNRVNGLTQPGNPDSIHKIFASFDTEVVGKSTVIGGTMSGTFNLNQASSHIYRVPGSMTMNATQFCSGSGTIYVEGNLTINGNTSYCPYGGTDRSQLPSVGIIVAGNITINPTVTNVVGSFFTNGTFSTGSLLDAAGNDRTTRGDAQFSLNGLVVAYNFALQRQPNGTSNSLGAAAERFIYDGRVVVATPPAFNSLYTAPAVWNEAAPSN